MPGQVRTDTDRMTKVGQDAQQIAQNIRTQARAIEDVATGLLGRGWQGQAATAARGVVEAQAARAAQLVQVLDGHGDATMRGSTAIAGQEDSAAARLRGVGGMAQSLNRSPAQSV